MMARSTSLQSEAGYIDARPHQLSRRNLLHRTAGPYIRVILDGRISITLPGHFRSTRKADIYFNALKPQRTNVKVESKMGAVAWGLWPTPRFPSPLIEPDVPISAIRLSDWFHRKAHAGPIGELARRRSKPSSPWTI